MQIVSHIEALDQSPVSSNLGCNVLLVQLGSKLLVVSKHPAEMAGDEGVCLHGVLPARVSWHSA